MNANVTGIIGESCVVCKTPIPMEFERLMYVRINVSICCQCESAWKKKMGAVHIFAMNECDWVAAADMNSALEFYKKHVGGAAAEEFIDEPHQLVSEDLDRIKFTRTVDDDEPRGTFTFREQLVLVLTRGEEIPTFFASTEF